MIESSYSFASPVDLALDSERRGSRFLFSECLGLVDIFERDIPIIADEGKPDTLESLMYRNYRELYI